MCKNTICEGSIRHTLSWNAVISPNFLLWKFCGKLQFLQRFGRFETIRKLYGNCISTQFPHQKVTVFYAVLAEINNFCILFAVTFQTTKSTDCLKFILKIYDPWISCKYRTSRPRKFSMKWLFWKFQNGNFRANMVTSLKLYMFKDYADYFGKIFRRTMICWKQLNGCSTKNIPFNF